MLRSLEVITPAASLSGVLHLAEPQVHEPFVTQKVSSSPTPFWASITQSSPCSCTPSYLHQTSSSTQGTACTCERGVHNFQMLLLGRPIAILEQRTWYMPIVHNLNNNVQHQLPNVKVICGVSILSKMVPYCFHGFTWNMYWASLLRTLKPDHSNKKKEILFCR